MSEKRVSKHWEYNPNIKIDKFDIDDLNEKNLINYLLILSQSDVSYSLIMRLFGSFNGKSLCHQYDTFDVPAKYYHYTNEKGKNISNQSKFTTTIGIWIFNIFFIKGFNFCNLFNGYINENINKGLFEDINQKIRLILILIRNF
jgi:hypothetical protein